MTETALASLTTLGLGGPARAVHSAQSSEELVALVRKIDREDTPLLVLGKGSNVVVADEGFDGAVVLTANRERHFVDEGIFTKVTAGAGEVWDDLVRESVDRALSGIECMSGIAGTVGAAPVQNIGAYGQELCEVFESCVVWDRSNARNVTLDREAMRFGYRESILKNQQRGRYVVLSVTLALKRIGPRETAYTELSRALEGQTSPTVGDLREVVLKLRRAKGMVFDASDPDTRSAGSFFTNPIVSAELAGEVTRRARERGVVSMSERPAMWNLPDGRVKLAAGWLIEKAGIFKGFSLGDGTAGARVSPRHCLALVNRGGTTEDLLALARWIRTTVRDTWRVELVPEPEFVGFGVSDPTA